MRDPAGSAPPNKEPQLNSKPVPETGDPRWLLSALADGELDAADCERACAAWADPSAQRDWHAYQLIGDVLRSDELASVPLQDMAFLERLRLRLADEPALPAALHLQSAPSAAPPRRRAWAVPVALAAGVAALATALMLSRGPESPAPTMAAAPAAAAGLPKLEAGSQGGRLIRDVQLDRYLAAHREYGAAQPGSLPGGAGRNLATVSLDRP
jgi:sigma-E factor negative regulatory protein RseA